MDCNKLSRLSKTQVSLAAADEVTGFFGCSED